MSKVLFVSFAALYTASGALAQFFPGQGSSSDDYDVVTIPLSDLDNSGCSVTTGVGGACSWTGSCTLPDCAAKCVVNEAISDTDSLNSLFLNKTLDAIQCPVAAQFVYMAGGAGVSSGGSAAVTDSPPPTTANAEFLQGAPPGFRKLLEDGRLYQMVEFVQSLAGNLPTAGRLHHHMLTASGGLTHSGRLLSQSEDGDDDLVGQGCPSDDLVDQNADDLEFFSQALSSSGPSTLGFQPGTAEYELFAFFLPLAGSPEDLKAYFGGDCKTETVSGQLVGLYAGIQGLEDDPPGTLSNVTACRDLNMASEDLIGSLNTINQTCTAAFAASPVPGASCIDNGAHSLSAECLTAYADFLDFSTDNLQTITDPYNEIHSACMALTDSVTCVNHVMNVTVTEVEEAIEATLAGAVEKSRTVEVATESAATGGYQGSLAAAATAAAVVLACLQG